MTMRTGGKTTTMTSGRPAPALREAKPLHLLGSLLTVDPHLGPPRALPVGHRVVGRLSPHVLVPPVVDLPVARLLLNLHAVDPQVVRRPLQDHPVMVRQGAALPDDRVDMLRPNIRVVDHPVVVLQAVPHPSQKHRSVPR